MDKGTLDLILSILEINRLTNTEIKKWLLAKPMHESDLSELTQLLKENKDLLTLLKEKIG